MTPQTPVPARLFVLLARALPVGVILRRDPSDWVQMIHWNTTNDKFEPGQWFHGRINERKCDLSPNGKRFVYDAYKPGNALANPDYGDRWTAVSKPPYFTALVLWTHKKFHGGGGHFENNKTLQLNLLADDLKVHPDHQPHHLKVNAVDAKAYMRNSVFYHNMLRDGWGLTRSTWESKPYARLPFWSKHKFAPDNNIKSVMEKMGGYMVSPMTLICKISFHYRLVEYHGSRRKSLYEIVPEYQYAAQKFSFRFRGNSPEQPLMGVTWADFDQRRRAIAVKDGKIFTIQFNEGDDLIFTELADFNANQPEAVESPAWAKKW